MTDQVFDEVRVLALAGHDDERGRVVELWRAAGLAAPFVQANLATSRRGALRGLHYQLRRPQGKLVVVTSGAIVDVAVDLRRGSPGFARPVITRLDAAAATPRAVWIPPGFAHGVLALSERAAVVYQLTAPYDPDDQRAIRWDDPDLAIPWPLDELGDLGGAAPILSERDRAAPWLRDAELPT